MSSISFTIEDSGVSVLEINTPGSVENRLSQDSFTALEEFLSKIDGTLDMVESDDEIKAVVIASGKEKSFISGADLGEYLGFTLADEGRSYSLKAQEVSEKIENSRVPFVASIQGACLGVGLELAVACRYRIASDSRETLLGLDQIDLGLIPCAGGVHRLAKLIGTGETLDMILTGEALDPYYSKRLGLVDEVVPEEFLRDISKKRAIELSGRQLKPRRHRFGGMANALIKENPLSRRMVLGNAKKQIKENRELHVPALRMAVEALEIGVSSFNRGLHVESVYFGELAVTGYSRQLIRTSIAIDEIKNDTTFTKPVRKTRKEQGKIAVVGDEFSGAGIACLAADNGIRVRIKGQNDTSAGLSLKECYGYFTEKLANREIGELEVEKKLDLVSAASDYSGFKRAEIVIESAGEDPELKRRILREVESHTGGGSIYVSNSFALPAADIAAVSAHPDKVVGMRIPGPVFETELLEIAVGEHTSPETVGEVVEFGRRLGKIPLVVRDRSGFYTTRIQLAYFNECLHLLGEGVGAENIEEAMTIFGFPEGPLAAMDGIGIDLVKKGSDILYRGSGERAGAHPLLDQLLSEGRTGRRAGKGFYRYARDERRIDRSIYKLLSAHGEDSRGISHEYIQDRLVLALVNEAMICLQDEVIRSAKEGDAGAVLGLGFPTQRGGPFSYVDSAGAGDVLKKLHNLSVRYGTRYTPPPLLKNIAVGGGKFYES